MPITYPFILIFCANGKWYVMYASWDANSSCKTVIYEKRLFGRMDWELMGMAGFDMVYWLFTRIVNKPNFKEAHQVGTLNVWTLGENIRSFESTILKHWRNKTKKRLIAIDVNPMRLQVAFLLQTSPSVSIKRNSEEKI